MAAVLRVTPAARALGAGLRGVVPVRALASLGSDAGAWPAGCSFHRCLLAARIHSASFPRGRGSRAIATASTASPSAEVVAEKSDKSEKSESAGSSSEEKKPEKAKWSTGYKVFLFTSTISGLTFLYYFYKSGYNLHKTEALLAERYRTLPLYPPPGPSLAAQNTTIDGHGLPDDMVAEFCEWFVALDLKMIEGVTREDVLELMSDFGFNEDDKVCKDFVARGEGSVEERRRLTGCGLHDAITLLAKLALPAEGVPCDTAKHQEILEVLKRKKAPLGSVVSGGALMQQAMGALQQEQAFIASKVAQLAPEAGSNTAGQAAETTPVPQAAQSSWSSFGGGSAGAATAAPADAVDDVDEAEIRRLEVSRLQRTEDELMKRLERVGSLSPGEEARLEDCRQRKIRLSAAR